MAKFIVETIATIKHTYAIEAEDIDAAVDKYFENQETLEPVTHFFVGELLSDINEVCCDHHFQELVDSSTQSSTEREEDPIKIGIPRSLN